VKELIVAEQAGQRSRDIAVGLRRIALRHFCSIALELRSQLRVVLFERLDRHVLREQASFVGIRSNEQGCSDELPLLNCLLVLPWEALLTPRGPTLTPPQAQGAALMPVNSDLRRQR
jgi:hypothetical protein